MIALPTIQYLYELLYDHSSVEVGKVAEILQLKDNLKRSIDQETMQTKEKSNIYNV